jgi:hypothetical protein
VAQELMEIAVMSRAATRVWAILDAWVSRGGIGLLYGSEYPAYAELCLLERYLTTLGNSPADIKAAVPQIQSDLVMLVQSILSVSPTLWHQNLLTDRPQSAARIRYQRFLLPRQRQNIVTALTDIDGYTQNEADKLFSLYMEQGLPGIIDWRCTPTDGTSKERLEQRRWRIALDAICQNLDPLIRKDIEQMLDYLHAAIRQCDLTLPLLPLITDRASSRRRRRWKRLLAQHQLNVLPQRPKAARQHGKKQWRLKPKKSSQEAPTLATQISHALAEHANLTKSEAKFHVHEFLTYGVLGLLPKSLWTTIIPPRLFSWLQLIKQGHPTGAVGWSDIAAGAITYCRNNEIPKPSDQLLQAVFNTIDKPRFAHGGKGIAVMRVHQRIPHAVTSWPRLHAASMVMQIQLRPAKNRSTLPDSILMVFDEESQLPLGAWPVNGIASSREVGLALYQAIWHPGAINWPIRGISRIVRIPNTLIEDGTADLEHAAAELLIGIESVPHLKLRKQKRVFQIIEQIQEWASDQDTEHSTPERVLSNLLEWLQDAVFPAHNQRRPKPRVRQYGVAMPGFDTSASGWLLPVNGSVETTSTGVKSDGLDYTCSSLDLEPGIILPRRAFPYIYPTNEPTSLPGVFVQTNIEGRLQLHYATKQ